MTQDMTQHTTTDPACQQHELPRTRWQIRRYDRRRGVPCLPCMTARIRSATGLPAEPSATGAGRFSV